MGVSCVETQALAWPLINEPLCAETQHLKPCPDAGGIFNPSRQRQITQDRTSNSSDPQTAPNHSGLPVNFVAWIELTADQKPLSCKLLRYNPIAHPNPIRL